MLKASWKHLQWTMAATAVTLTIVVYTFEILKKHIDTSSNTTVRAALSVPSLSTHRCDTACYAAALNIDMQTARKVDRARARMERYSDKLFTFEQVARALAQRKAILNNTVSVDVSDDAQSQSGTWILPTSQFPWLVHWDSGKTQFQISTHVLAQLLQQKAFPQSLSVENVHIHSIEKDKLVNRGVVTGVGKSGFLYNDDAVSVMANALESGHSGALALRLPHAEPLVTIDALTGVTLELLGSGRSNFSKSPKEREQNIHKALNEHVHNTLVAPGEIFSFNATLGGPVTTAKGWVEALGLFGGGAALTPGGGICQAATTVYRAALLAGLPIVEKRNHSLYVSYYEKYGVGVDATIFPGIHDLSFKNDTENWILVQAYTEGEDAIVSLYGVRDGRTVTVEGPYFSGTSNRPKELRALAHAEIGWVQRVTYSNGTVKVVPLISHYAKPIAHRSLSTQYAPGNLAQYQQSGETMHAAPTNMSQQ